MCWTAPFAPPEPVFTLLYPGLCPGRLTLISRWRPWAPLPLAFQSASASRRHQQEIRGDGLVGVVFLSQRPQLFTSGSFLQLQVLVISGNCSFFLPFQVKGLCGLLLLLDASPSLTGFPYLGHNHINYSCIKSYPIIASEVAICLLSGPGNM